MLIRVKALAFMTIKCFTEKLEKYSISMCHCITLNGILMTSLAVSTNYDLFNNKVIWGHSLHCFSIRMNKWLAPITKLIRFVVILVKLRISEATEG